MPMPVMVVTIALEKTSLKNVGALRAERDPDSHFMSALGDRVSDHAVNSDRGQDQRESGKRAEQKHVETPLCHRIGEIPFHGLDLGNGLIFIERLDLFAQGRRQRSRIHRRADDEHSSPRLFPAR